MVNAHTAWLVAIPLLFAPLVALAPSDAPFAGAPLEQQGGGGGATHHVHIVDFAFSPESLTVDEGDTVVWHNHDVAPHTSTADDGTWDSGILETGDTYAWTVAGAGALDYHCEVHPSMTAELVVPTAPGAPLATSGLPSGIGAVTVTWQPPGDDGGSPITAYRVYRAALLGASPALVGEVTGTSFTDTGVATGAYTYEVTAVNAIGEGPASTPAPTVAVGP